MYKYFNNNSNPGRYKMIQVHKQKLTFEEYLTYEDNTDNRYEVN